GGEITRSVVLEHIIIAPGEVDAESVRRALVLLWISDAQVTLELERRHDLPLVDIGEHRNGARTAQWPSDCQEAARVASGVFPVNRIAGAVGESRLVNRNRIRVGGRIRGKVVRDRTRVRTDDPDETACRRRRHQQADISKNEVAHMIASVSTDSSLIS